MKRLAEYLKDKLNSLPTGIRIILYVGFSGLLALIQKDLLELDINNPYITLGITMINNVILYYITHINKVIDDLKETVKEVL